MSNLNRITAMAAAAGAMSSLHNLARNGPSFHSDHYTPAHRINPQAFSGTVAAKGKRGKRRERGRRKALNRERRVLLGAFGIAGQFLDTRADRTYFGYVAQAMKNAKKPFNEGATAPVVIEYTG